MASLTKNTQNKIALMGVVLDNFMRPCGTEAGKCEFSRRLFSPIFSILFGPTKVGPSKKPGRRVEGTSVVFAGCQTDFWGLG